MIFGFMGGERLRGMQVQLVSLRVQLDAVSGHVAALSQQLAREADRAELAIIEAERMRTQLEALLSHQEATSEALAIDAAAITKQLGNHGELIDRGRADLVRLEKQAKIDLDEMRRINCDVAETFLRHGVNR